MRDWLSALSDVIERGQDCVLISVADTRGSTPRETGAKLLVTRDAVFGTIGGGNLEHKAIEFAKNRLRDFTADSGRCELRRFPLGPTLGQCCGGVAILHFEHLTAPLGGWAARLLELNQRGKAAVLVRFAEGLAASEKLVVTASGQWGELGESGFKHKAVGEARRLLMSGAPACLRRLGADAEEGPLLMIEPLRPSDFHIVLFGAGHVGRAVANILGSLHCTVTWVDSRADQFPKDLPTNVTAVVREAPEPEVVSAPGGSHFLIMTHSHPLDQSICEQVLRRDDFRYCGLIGSRSKRRKFEKRLVAGGLDPALLEKLTCPIGVEGIAGKKPSEIAVGTAAQLLQVQSRVAAMKCPQGIAEIRVFCAPED